MIWRKGLEFTGLSSVISDLFCRDEAEMNYLKIAQDLEMYGVNYFPIAVSVSEWYF